MILKIKFVTIRSPSDVDAHGRASVLKDGAAFRPKSAPHPLLMENHHYQSFMNNSDTPTHPHTAPHTPTELERELERDRSLERGNGEHRESVAEGMTLYTYIGIHTQTFFQNIAFIIENRCGLFL